MRTKLSLILAVFILSSVNLDAQAFFWWDGGPQQGDSSLTPSSITGTRKVLILVVEFPDDSADYGDGTLPALYDSLITRDYSYKDSSLYQWSYTNFIGTASWDKLMMIGEVNPTFNGHYIIAPHNLAYYDSVGPQQLNIDIVGLVDDSLDYSQYDANRDGYVDYAVFFHPRNPLNNYADENNYGQYLGIFPGGPCPSIETDDGVSFNLYAHAGSTHSYYTFQGNSEKQIKRDEVVALMAHELGHAFGLDESYEDAHSSPENPHAWSAGQGKYTCMQLGYYTKHAHLYSPYERITLGWVTPVEIDTNTQNVRLIDLNSGDPDVDTLVYKIAPHDTQYFLVTNHQQKTHWEDDYGLSFPAQLNRVPFQSDTNAKGLLIWHIITVGQPQPDLELFKPIDLECAEGLHDLWGDTTASSPWGTEAGWDRLDRWMKIPEYSPWESWDDSMVHASSSHANDFFKPGYRTAFHSLTNPSSDLHLINGYGGYGQFSYSYPEGSYGGRTWDEVEEEGCRQNVASHVAIEGIHYDTSEIEGSMKMCIRRSRIWTDSSEAMDRTTQRKSIYDPDDTFHLVYPSKGYVYYTQTHDPSKNWSSARFLGRGKWPVLGLSGDHTPYVIWFDEEHDSIRYNYSGPSIVPGWLPVWKYTPKTIVLPGTPGPIAADYGGGTVGTTTNPGGTDISTPDTVNGSGAGTIHLAYITNINGQDELHYASFYKIAPENLADICLDDDIDESSRIIGASIEVDTILKKVCIAYGCVRNDTAASYYFEKDSNGTWHGPTRLPSSVSDSTNEPLVPFIDIDSVFHRVVFSANGKIYFNKKYRTVGYQAWPASCTLITQMSGFNTYPQIAGDRVTWTNYVTTDSSNVWARSLNASAFRLDTAYSGKSYYAQTTKVGSGSAQLYQHGTFTGPKWAIYYRGPNGFGGNQEREGEPVIFIPKEPLFKMSIPDNILVGSKLSIFTTGGDCMITVYDVSGRQVARQELKGVQKLARIETPVDCDEWAKGVYFVRAVPKDGKVATSKVVLVK